MPTPEEMQSLKEELAEMLGCRPEDITEEQLGGVAGGTEPDAGFGAKLQTIMSMIQMFLPMSKPIVSTLFEVIKMLVDGYDESGLLETSVAMSKKRFKLLTEGDDGFTRQEALILMLNAQFGMKAVIEQMNQNIRQEMAKK
jgi:hypothetical protein